MKRGKLEGQAPLEHECLRLFRRYQLEIVEAYALCPWAEPARRTGTMRERVLVQTGEDVAPTLDALGDLDAEAKLEVAVLIYPRIGLGHQAFERFVTAVRDADAKEHALGAIPFAMAAFHPDAPIDLASPERLIPFLRRTPDPTIQIVRSAVLERVRGSAPQGTSFVDPATFDFTTAAQPPLRERIARANLARVQACGIEKVEAALGDIRRDRDATYARLA